ncbi:similar to Saccharomyces cerevisiae YKR031C SPO14 Phospholipase D, catalyzes the hydrolysis of phosphatidylcholine, producing choline and phosphatidic acid [Maudiozyma saulgeensis]|uniref:Phospholipase D1 n=1 Tax=Maudiozyma saulgeensis TaxID=1789683 RepID=A0A1X7R1H9_9SACH|nr:similar to Saccharomyces cerevisiae YKR031C SPO14 Phospholipase D, catalyzes the hydrolysis of phosphatidylcholine, producing choline and phosphatidic acid [Kazachstania saulgeensis]
MTSVIPGIFEANEPNDNEQQEVTDQDDINSTESKHDKIEKPGDDRDQNNNKNRLSSSEEKLKNLSFQGIPNSVLNKTNATNRRNRLFHKRSQSPLNNGSNNKTKRDHSPTSPRSSTSRNYTDYFPSKLNKQQHHQKNKSLDELAYSKLNNDYNDDQQKDRRKSLISSSDQSKFNGWRKEFNTAFKKISVVSKLKNKRGSNLKNNGSQPQVLSTDELLMKESHTQKMASDLIASMLAGCPAAVFASTQFLRDEHGNRRAPILLTMLDVRVKPIENISEYLNRGQSSNYFGNRNETNKNNTLPNNHVINNVDISLSRRSSLLSFSSLFLQDNDNPLGMPNDNTDINTNTYPLGNTQSPSQNRTSNNRINSSNNKNNNNISDIFNGTSNHDLKSQIFELSFEYGIGDNRYRWSITKTYNNMQQLHHNLKIVAFQQNTVKKLYIDNNRFHKFRLPYFPTLKEKSPKDEKTRGLHILSRTNSLSSSTSSNSSINSEQTLPSANFDLGQIKMKHLQDLIDEEDDSNQPMDVRLERYFRLLNLALCLRPQANRLFQFYEFSPMGNLLSYETGYQGREGFLLIRSTAKTQGWRVSHFNAHDFKDMIERHTPKWFLVRGSYITYTSDICSTTPLDVFLVDSKFKIKCSGKMKRKEAFHVNKKKSKKTNDEIISPDELDWDLENSKSISTNLLITLQNSERKLQIICKSEASLKLWVSSFTLMAKSTVWSRKNRFNSFAPVRQNAFCKLLVDGRDYFWSLSEALKRAQDVIYIHDWWLSPELYLRRPVDAHQEYRIDRMLRKCAERGVKIFIIVYRNVGATVGTDSLWTKHSMLGLHPNIHLIRSPNQWLQNTYFWAHHEKLCVIDNTIAFMGGTDLCFGRYDTPEHVLRDDYKDIKDQTFPGKDYSNARVCDFYELDKPFESMYDREEVPRMPWHDVQMMTVGEPARDMARHFIQRWNYLLREKRPSRPTPLLLPPSDFTKNELENSPFFQSLKPRSTCEVQVLRSAGYWSLGLKETEKSIQNAYLKLIETSKHYMYIENQFFITTSEWDGVVIENKIGDAIVDRIVRANSEGTDWKAFIIIPLMPGFDSPIDQPEASSLRVIMQCQYQSISRGETSIFSRLKKLNIDPMQYIRFFSLRKWSTIGPFEKLVTEQLYVHAKILIVDDRSCIIGSANINERSQLGNRDSEVAIVIRDTDLVKTKMNGKDYYAGRYALEMRQRLMREHLGCDTDLVEIVERKFGRLEKLAKEKYKTLNTLDENQKDKIGKKKLHLSAMIELAYREILDCEYSPQWRKKFKTRNNTQTGSTPIQSFSNTVPSRANNNIGDSSSILDVLEISAKRRRLPSTTKSTRNNSTVVHSFNYRSGTDNVGIRDNKPISYDPRLIKNTTHQRDVDGKGADDWKKVTESYKESVSDQLKEWALKAMSLKLDNEEEILSKNQFLPSREDLQDYIACKEISDDKKWDMLKRVCYLQYLSHKISTHEYEKPKFNQKPKTPSKFNSTNTEEIHTGHSELLEEQELDDETLDILLGQLVPTLSRPGINKENMLRFSKLKFIDPYSFDDPLIGSFSEETLFLIAMRNTLLYRLVFHCQPDNAVQTWRDFKDFKRMSEDFVESQNELIDLERKHLPKKTRNSNDTIPSTVNDTNYQRKHNGDSVDDSSGTKVTTNGLDKLGNDKARALSLQMKLGGSILYGFNKRIFDKYTARRILDRIHGHLVLFPTEWLAREVESKNWFYNADRLPPIDIYD